MHRSIATVVAAVVRLAPTARRLVVGPAVADRDLDWTGEHLAG